MKNLEQELKLALTEREYELLAATTEAKPMRMTNYYFVADGQTKDVMVRIRQIGDNYLLCFKRRLSCADDVMVCTERECVVDEAFTREALTNGLKAVSVNRIFDVDEFYENFDYVGNMCTERTCFTLQNRRIELDKCTYLGTVDYELECECDRADLLAELKNYLNHTFGIVLKKSEPKNARFLKRLHEINADN